MSKKLPRALSDPSQTTQTTTPTQITTTRKRKHISLAFEEGTEISSEITVNEKKVKSEPLKWREIYQLIHKMRKENPAPVDTMGCSELSDEESPPPVKRYQTLISLMLSSQTKDQITYQAMNKLKKHGLNIENIRKIEISKLQELIYPVSFYLRKAIYIKETTEILYEKYNSDIPNSAEELMKLKGVGPKMAYLCMTCAWGITEGIGVDVHVHRISNRLHWVKTSTPEETRKSLESWLPYEYWDDINKLLVGFGQTICTPVSPKCQICLINSLCPSAFVESKSAKRKKSTKNNNNNNNNNNDEREYKGVDDEDEYEEKKPKRRTKPKKKSI